MDHLFAMKMARLSLLELSVGDMDAPQPITLESMPGTLQLWTGLKTTWHVMVVLHPHPHQALVDLRNGKEMAIAMMKTTMLDAFGTEVIHSYLILVNKEDFINVSHR